MRSSLGWSQSVQQVATTAWEGEGKGVLWARPSCSARGWVGVGKDVSGKSGRVFGWSVRRSGDRAGLSVGGTRCAQCRCSLPQRPFSAPFPS